ncbi:hypothetical protein BH23CHL2_BH23CHL2_06840 [soil metagenome]
MPHKFSSFLLRWWRSDESERLEIEHIQSGRKLLTASIEDAVGWLHDQMNGAQNPQESERGDSVASGRETTDDANGG